ncbi:MAG: MBL fold metallo-hydrolase [Spirochaeta sp.]
MVERIIVGPLHTNAYIYSISKKECIIIDPGADPHLLQQKLDAINMRPRGIIFTHGYLDHISATLQLMQAYSEFDLDIQVGIHTLDAHLLGAGGIEQQHDLFRSTGNESIFQVLNTELPEYSFTYNDGDTIMDTGLRVIHTPGRSLGSVCFYEEAQNLVFTGDTLLFKDIGKTNLPEADRQQLLASVRTHLFSLPPETVVFPGHGPRTTIERERRNNPIFR